MGRETGDMDRAAREAEFLAWTNGVAEPIKKRVPAAADTMAARKNVFRRLPVTDPPTEF